VTQPSGPRDVPPDGPLLDGHQPDGRLLDRWRSYDWQDPAVAADAARTMAGLDFLRAIADGTLPAPPIARALDFYPVSVEP
jgi:hypothetical protein